MARARSAINDGPKLKQRGGFSVSRRQLLRGLATLAPVVAIAVCFIRLLGGDPALAQVREALGKIEHVSYFVQAIAVPAGVQYTSGQVMMDVKGKRHRLEAEDGSVFVDSEKKSMFLNPQNNYATFGDGGGSEEEIFPCSLKCWHGYPKGLQKAQLGCLMGN